MKHGRRIVDFTTLELLSLIFSDNFPSVARKLGLRLFSKDVGDFFQNVFLQTLEYREKNDVNRNDFVSMLLKLKGQMDPTEMAAESLLVFAAGYETSSTLMQFTLYELAMNPDIQQRLREEIQAGIDENDGKLTYDMLSGFKYLEMVINESLRKYPPIPAFSRRCTADYKIPDSDLVIPQGTTAFVCTYSLHHDPEYFPAPEKFNPERFNEENEKFITPFTLLPFGEGARQCLGEKTGYIFKANENN
jgi:cytochrome P450 family 6